MNLLASVSQQALATATVEETVIEDVWGPYTKSSNNSGSWANYTMRQSLVAGQLLDTSAKELRFHIAASTAEGLSLGEAFIGPRDGSTYNFSSAPTRITFGGNNGIEIAADEIGTSDWINYTYDGTQDLLLSIYVNNDSGADGFNEVNFDDSDTRYALGNLADDLSGSWDMGGAGRLRNCLTKIESRNDPYVDDVVLLMDFNNDMAPLEDVTGRHTPIDDDRTVFGTMIGSRALNGEPGDSLIRVPNSADFQFGSDDFTVEWWNDRENSSNNAGFIGIWDTSGQRSWIVWRSFADLRVSLSSDGVNNDLGMDTTILESSSRQHIALVRDGNTFRIYMGGVERASRVSTAALHASTGDLYIGGHPGFSPSRSLMDDIRITKGVCRYPNGTTFTPPESPFSRPVPLVQSQRTGVSKASVYVIHKASP